ncbi:MAG TPA: GNAT family N-acetyltransferase, partial [Gemmatimonadaceae bacterium]|nr:GNAT family N-acetyltransferase [Gemmatimonadaceae bacterium]
MKPADVPALESLLRDSTDSTVFHRPEWHEAIRATYGHSCDYWLAFRGGRVEGAFPVVHMRVPFLGAKMVAMTYQMHSGHPIGRPETHAALVEAAVARARTCGVRHLEIRHTEPIPWLETLGFRRLESGLCTSSMGLDGVSFATVRRNHRRSVRSAEQQGLTVEVSDSLDDLRAFWRLYRQEGRSLGAPQAGWGFYESMHRVAPACYRLFLARVAGRVVGGLFTLGDGNMAFARNAAYSSAEALATHAGAALYWHAIADATARGVRCFNCGLSWERDQGLIHWKEGWGAVTRPVHLYALPVREMPPAPGGYFEGYRAAKAVWRRMPLALADR